MKTIDENKAVSFVRAWLESTSINDVADKLQIQPLSVHSYKRRLIDLGVLLPEFKRNNKIIVSELNQMIKNKIK